jgi:hypothetical protein
LVYFHVHFTQHCFICRQIASKDAGIDSNLHPLHSQSCLAKA